MVSKFALGNILLASAALAAPSSQQGALLARQPHLVNSHGIALSARAPDVVGNSNQAGVIVTLNNGALTTVSGTFAVPSLSGGENGSGFSTWIGLDNYSCPDGFQAGIADNFIDGVDTYSVWYRFVSPLAQTRAQIKRIIDLNPNDVLKVTVTTFGYIDQCTVIIENQTTNRTVSWEATPGINDFRFCGKDARWVTGFVDDVTTLADFGIVKFTDAMATGPGGTVSPLNATTKLEIVQNQDGHDTIYTLVNITEDSLIVGYLSGH